MQDIHLCAFYFWTGVCHTCTVSTCIDLFIIHSWFSFLSIYEFTLQYVNTLWCAHKLCWCFIFQEHITLAVFGKLSSIVGPQCSPISYFIWPFNCYWFERHSNPGIYGLFMAYRIRLPSQRTRSRSIWI